MEEITVTQLGKHLSGYLLRVRRGERLQITSRSKVIAEIVPPSVLKNDAEAARARLLGSLLRYDMPLDPVIQPAEWEVNR